MRFHTHFTIVIAMLRTGILGYGGGPSVIPLFRHEAVIRYRWIEDEEFGDLLAFANALPGPIATKMAAQLGYQLKGVSGAFLAVIAHILPTTLGMIGLLSFLYALQDSFIIAGMIAAVRPVVAVLLGIMAYDFCSKSVNGLGKIVSIILILLALLFLAVLEVHPAITIFIFLAYGTVHIRIAKNVKHKWNKRYPKDKEDLL